MSGKLIVFEGTDGSGKATQSKLLFERLQRARGLTAASSTFRATGKNLPRLSSCTSAGRSALTRTM